MSFIAFGIYLGLAQKYDITIEVNFQILMFFDILSVFIPSPLPIYFNMNYSFSFARLRAKDIMGTTLEKTVEGALIKVFCFDKTGTITEEEVKIKGICLVNDENMFERDLNAEENELVMKLLGSCHLVKKIEDNLSGDELDKKIFLYSKY